MKEKMKETLKRWRQAFNNRIEQSEFCRVLGITPWHFTLEGMAVTAIIGLVLIFTCGIAELLEGGRAW